MEEILKNKFDNFADFVFDIVDENNKILVSNEINEIKWNKLKQTFFIIMLNKNKIEENINSFMQKFNIKDEHKQKITYYYNFFLEVKDVILSS